MDLSILILPSCCTAPEIMAVLFFAGILITSPETNSKLNLEFDP